MAAELARTSNLALQEAQFLICFAAAGQTAVSDVHFCAVTDATTPPFAASYIL
jgi:hypothetical protein